MPYLIPLGQRGPERQILWVLPKGGPYTGYQTRDFPPARLSPNVSVFISNTSTSYSYALEIAFKEFIALDRIDCAGGKITFFGLSPYSLASLLNIELHSSE